MAKKKNIKPNDLMGRSAKEASETYPTQVNDLPNDRFQNKVQTSTAAQTVTKGNDFTTGQTVTGSIEPSSTSIVARSATAVKKKMAIKPTSDTGLDDSKLIGGVPLGDAGVGASVAGPIDASIPRDTSRVPYTNGGYRANERYGKKISTDNFVINNVVSEQIDPSFDEPKDVREAPEALQGYNGRKQFKTARGKKIYGDHPGSTLFERSVDFEEHSSVIHATGQVLNNIDTRAGYPVARTDNDDVNNGEFFVAQTKGNYLINAFNIEIKNGHITNLSFDEDRIVTPIDYDSANYANMNWQVDANNVAAAMVRMQTELGRETTDKWSPLGYVVSQPYEFGMLFHDGEAILGSLTGASYKSAAHSLAYLQNKMSKEGVRGVSSIAEWLGEGYAHASDSTYYSSEDPRSIFNSSNYSKGSAAAIIAMFDSTQKYTTKADFINQPRSFKMHLQTVDNNINPFHAKKEFYKALDSAMMFSTFDGQYNPTLPIHVTNTVKVMLPYSLNKWLYGWKNPHTNNKPANSKFTGYFEETGLVAGCGYSYTDLRNKYDWTYVDPFVAGLCRWLLRHEAAVVKAFGNDANVSIPVSFGLSSASLFAFMVCSASQDMAWMRNVIFRDYLFAGEQGVYVWNDLASLSELDPTHASQYKYNSYGEALTLGSLNVATKIRVLWPEIIVPKEAKTYKNVWLVGDEVGDNIAYFLPFYFNEEGIDDTTASGVSDVHGAVMSYPIIHNGVNHEFVDILYSMSERDVRLCLDKMVTLPVTTTYANKTVTGAFNADKYDKYALRYDTNSDGRVIISQKYTNKNSNAYALHEWTYLATPRELGFLFPLPLNKAKQVVLSDKMVGTVTAVNNVVEDAYITGGSSSFMTCYRASSGSGANGAIDRSASLTQVWDRCFASPCMYSVNNAFIKEVGIVPSFAAIIDAEYAKGDSHDLVTTFALKAPEVYTVDGIYNLRSQHLAQDNFTVSAPAEGEPAPSKTGSLCTSKIFSLAKCLWTILQRSYSPINKYDAAFIPVGNGGATPATEHCLASDPLELAEYFGFAGCLGSDYNQDILARLDKKDQLGMFYYEDEFIKSSLIFG